jgi:hypothetical protein
LDTKRKTKQMSPDKTRLAGVAATLILAVSGCGLVGESARTEAPAKPVAAPRDELIKAVPTEKAPAFAFDVQGGLTPISGVVDAARETIQVKVVHSDAGFTMTMTALSVAEQGWIKIAFKPAKLPGVPPIPNKWLVVDPAKLTDKDSAPVGYDGDTDPGNALLLVRNAAAVTETDQGRYAGTTDLTASTEAEIVDQARITALGDKAKAVPFEAVVDDAGHLTLLLVKIPAAAGAKAATYRVTYTGFGTTEVPAAPAAGQRTKAPPFVYEMLNG